MKEIKAIINAYNQVDPTVTKAALATVVRVEGSSYRRTGARMLVLDNGNWVGGISGGCLEGDALKRARQAMEKENATLITYDTTEDDPYQIGIGLGCNGIIDVLFTPLNFNDASNPVAILASCVAKSRQTHILVTVTSLAGTWSTLHCGQVLDLTTQPSPHLLNEPRLQEALLPAIQQQLQLGRSAPCNFEVDGGRTFSAFIEILPPEIHAFIMGHQYDVYPLSRLLRELGWSISIVANPLKLNKSITEIAQQVIDPNQFSGLVIDAFTVIILMSHDYKNDKRNLPLALATPAPYIGLLGPRTRTERMLGELAAEGYPVSIADEQRLFAPIGLDIGAVSPEEIALSLAAEVRAVLSGRTGGFLKLRAVSIHDRG